MHLYWAWREGGSPGFSRNLGHGDASGVHVGDEPPIWRVLLIWRLMERDFKMLSKPRRCCSATRGPRLAWTSVRLECRYYLSMSGTEHNRASLANRG